MGETMTPCPWCGGEAELHDATRISGVWNLIHRCEALGPIKVEFFDRNHAIEAWNRRASPPDTTAPAGWKLVPVEADVAMHDAAVDTFNQHGFSPDGIYAAMLATSPSPPDAGVVKALEWEHHPKGYPPFWYAQTPFVGYHIEEAAGSDSPTYELLGPNFRLLSVTDGLEDAKAAAQADFDQRIRSALVAPSPDASGLREALALILPLAKGYVAHNDVGRNREFIARAEAALAGSD